MSYQQALSKAQQMTMVEFHKYKSKYIDFLVEQQCKDNKVIPCVERLSYQNINITEYSFLFSIKSKNGDILIVHENVNPDRSTLLFVVPQESYDKAIHEIYDFLQSVEINKRSSLRSKNLNLKNISIKAYKSINHDDIYSWEIEIYKYKRNQIKDNQNQGKQKKMYRNNFYKQQKYR